MPTQESYKAVYLEAIRELSDLNSDLKSIEERRDRIEQRIAEVKRGVLAIAPLCDEAPWSSYPELFPELVGALSHAVRHILRQDPKEWLSPLNVRARLRSAGYRTTSENILPSIHNVLKRLKAAGEVETQEAGRGMEYRLKPKPIEGEGPSD
jgi:hypothetical protein